jgi:hypothetical protein
MERHVGEYARFVVFTAVTMKNAVFWDIKTQFVPHRTHVSATELNQLMLCKICGFHIGDYEEWRLLPRGTVTESYMSLLPESTLCRP